MKRMLWIVGTICVALNTYALGETTSLQREEIWKLVYGSHLWVSIEEDPVREAALIALTMLDERNPEVSPAILMDTIHETLDAHRSKYSAAARYRMISRDEVLASYYSLLVANSGYAACRPVNLSLLKPLADSYSSGTDSFSFRFQSENEQTLSMEHALENRQQVIEAVTDRALQYPAFGSLLDSLIQSETGVSIHMTPDEILEHSPTLQTSTTMDWLAGLYESGVSGSVEVTTTELETRFTAEMSTLKDTISVNQSLHRDIEASQGDLGSYLHNESKMAALAAQQEQVKQDQQQRIAAASAATNALSQATLKVKPLTSEHMSTVATSMGSFARGMQAMDSASKFSKLTACTNFVSAGLSLVSMFIDTGPSPEQIILNEINALKDTINELATNIDYRFDQVDTTLLEVLGKVDESIQLIGEVGQNVTTIRRELLDVQTDLSRLERMIAEYFDYQERRDFIENANNKLQYERRTGDLMSWDYFKDWSESDFYTWAVSHCTDPISSPIPPSSYAYPESELKNDLTKHSLESNLNFIKGFLEKRLGVTGLAQGTVANPRDWYAGASAYLNLSIENPQHFRRLPVGDNRVGDILQKGRGIEAFLRSITLTGSAQSPQPNTALIEAVLAYYQQKLQVFLDAVKTEQITYSETYDFNPAMWLDWEDKVQPVQVAETAIQGYTTWARLPVDIVKISAGKQHFLALRSNGTVVAWGDNNTRQCEVPADLGNVIDIEAGAYHSLALRADGTVVAWGGYDNSMDPPEGLTDIIQISAGIHHNLALQGNGKVVAWGGNYSNECTIPEALQNESVVAVVAAGHTGGWGNHSLALTVDGKVYAWGSNDYGQCTVPEFPDKVVAIAATGLSSAAVLANGTVAGWPVPLAATSEIANLSLGYLFYESGKNTPFTAALTKSGGVEVLKGPSEGAPQTNDIVQVAVAEGVMHAVALHSDGTLSTWGWNSMYAFTGNHGQAIEPVVVDIASTDSHMVLLYDDGSIRENGYSIGNAPVDLPPAVAVAAGQGYGNYKQFSLALLEDGSVAAWGDNSYGQCNVPDSIAYHPDSENSVKVVAIAAGSTDSVNTGGGHSLALLEDGKVLAWGVNTHKQCDVPDDLSGVVAIDVGHRHSVALLANGKVRTWGDNTWGQQNTPTQYNDIVSISAGFSHTLGLRSNGQVIGWGANHYGQCTPPAGLTDVVAIQGGFSRSIALKADGTVKAWGWDEWGYLAWENTLTGVLRISSGGQGKDNFIVQSESVSIPDTGPYPIERQSRPSTAIATPFKQFYAQAIQDDWFVPNGKLSLVNPANDLIGARMLLDSILALGLPSSLEYDDALRGFLFGTDPIANPWILGDLYATEHNRLDTSPGSRPVDPTDSLWQRFDAFSTRLYDRLAEVATIGHPEIPRMLGHTLALLEILKQAHDGGCDGGVCPLPQLEITKSADPCVILHGEPYIHYTLDQSPDLTQWSNTILDFHDGEFVPVSPPAPTQPVFYRVPVPTGFQ